MTIFEKDIAIDMGTASTMLFEQGKGIVAREPTVVAVDKYTGKILKIGQEAQKMLGRTPANIVAIRPIDASVISDYEITAHMMRDLVNRITSFSLFKPCMLACVPSSISGVEERAMIDAAIEAGAKNGIFPVDDITRAYIKDRFQGTPVEYTADEDAEYDEEYTIDLSALVPTVAFPHLPENARTVDEIGAEEVRIDQAVIGSCTNGRISDLRAAADILRGRKVAKGVRCIIIPSTQSVYLQAMHEGLMDIFIEAGAVVSTPTCGPCLGGHMGILAKGERAISTTNRNFVGRMGHVESEVYLASPAVAAASAVTGYITDPRKL